MSQILDYSAGFPGAEAIADAGYVGAARYAGFPGSPKCTTGGELTDFDTHDRAMALVFEQGAGNWRKGFNQGIVDGRRARNHATAIGFPATRPIYMATDQDVVTTGEFATMIEYLKGAGTQLGGAHLTGVYGEADVIDRARDSGEACWFWQTAAWSRGRRTEAHLYQHVGTVYVGGIACDVNDVLADDWGQHNAKGGLIVATQQEIDAIAAAVWDRILPFSAPDGQTYQYRAADELLYTNWFANAIPGLVGAFGALASAVTGGHVSPEVIKSLIDTAVREAVAQSIEQTVMPAVRAAVLEAESTSDARTAAATADAVLAALANKLKQPQLLLPAAHPVGQITAAPTTQEGPTQ